MDWNSSRQFRFSHLMEVIVQYEVLEGLIWGTQTPTPLSPRIGQPGKLYPNVMKYNLALFPVDMIPLFRC